jgi:hypothetical protein
MPTRKRYRCRYCGTHLNAWLPWAKAPNSALLLGHLAQQHMEQLRPYLARMETEYRPGPARALRCGRGGGHIETVAPARLSPFQRRRCAAPTFS